MNVILREIFSDLLGSFTTLFFRFCCQQVLFTVTNFQSERWKACKIGRDLEMYLIGELGFVQCIIYKSLTSAGKFFFKGSLID